MLISLCNRLPSTRTVFLFLLSTTISLHSLTDKAAAARCHPDDEDGLLAFKSGITSDPSGILESWKSGTDCCTWNGIICGVDNRVADIWPRPQPDKPNSILSGTISPSLAKLQYLEGIYFIDLRNLSGPFPSFLFSLPRLVYIYIENNRLSGQLPQTIGNMTKLEAFSVEGNRFSGTIPSSIGQLTQLTQLKLGHNQFTGTIPDVFTAFNNLIVLYLAHNKFTGKIPQSISALAPTLEFLDLRHNFLTGQIPDFLGKFQTLNTLDLSMNNFSGVVPKTFSNLTKIFNLNLSRNRLVDPFPSMNVEDIESLDLSYNQFHLVNIPSWVTSSTIIESLKLAKCGLKLKLDDWNPEQTSLYYYIDLSENEITGSPFKLLNSTDYLVGFYASGNKLQFNLETLKFPKTLKFLDLSRNLVKGTVPSAVSGLEKLNVSHNHLCGQLPATKFPASAFAGNDCLCGSPLPPCKKV